MDVLDLPADRSADAVTLWQAAGLTRPWNDPDADLARSLAGPSSTVLAALDGDRLTGTVMVGYDGHRGWLYYLAVADDARRRGVGTALVRAAERWLQERGVPKVQLMVRRGNEPALAFYASLAYDDVEVHVVGRRLDGSVLSAS